MYNSTMKYNEIFSICNYFRAVKLIINGDTVWDDSLDMNDGWLSFDDAIKKFEAKNPTHDDFIIREINVKIVEFHHSIISVKMSI